MEKEMMSTKELSEFMGIGIHKAEKLVKKPDFPSIRLGKRYVVSKTELMKWIHTQSSSKIPYKFD